MLYILFNCAMFIRGHLDAINAVGRELFEIFVRSAASISYLSFLPWLMCAWYAPELYMCFDVCHAIFTEVYAMYFFIYVVTSTSMQTRLRNVVVFSPCSAVILMPCKLDATERSMHILRYFSNDVLNIWLSSIHSCPFCNYGVVYNVFFVLYFCFKMFPGRLFTCYSIWTRLL